MENVHSRVLSAPIERVRPWIAACWSGTERDAFPRDVIPTWRRNPDGVDPGALVPGQTLVGHGPFRFSLTEWDGARFRVEVVAGGAGWHGFDLEDLGARCRVTHTLSLALTGTMRLVVPLTLVPVHDWAVEAIFDRLEEALRTGRIPERTARAMPLSAAIPFWVMRTVRSRKKRARPATAAA